MFAHVTRSHILHNETKGGICIKIEFNPQKNISLLQHARRFCFFVYSSNMAAVTSCEHTSQLRAHERSSDHAWKVKALRETALCSHTLRPRMLADSSSTMVFGAGNSAIANNFSRESLIPVKCRKFKPFFNSKLNLTFFGFDQI